MSPRQKSYARPTSDPFQAARSPTLGLRRSAREVKAASACCRSTSRIPDQTLARGRAMRQRVSGTMRAVREGARNRRLPERAVRQGTRTSRAVEAGDTACAGIVITLRVLYHNEEARLRPSAAIRQQSGAFAVRDWQALSDGVQVCRRQGQILNGYVRSGDYRGCVTASADIRNTPLSGSTDTRTVPSRICSRRSPINSRRHPRSTGKSGVRCFSFASTRA